MASAPPLVVDSEWENFLENCSTEELSSFLEKLRSNNNNGNPQVASLPAVNGGAAPYRSLETDIMALAAAGTPQITAQQPMQTAPPLQSNGTTPFATAAFPLRAGAGGAAFDAHSLAARHIGGLVATGNTSAFNSSADVISSSNLGESAFSESGCVGGGGGGGGGGEKLKNEMEDGWESFSPQPRRAGSLPGSTTTTPTLPSPPFFAGQPAQRLFGSPPAAAAASRLGPSKLGVTAGPATAATATAGAAGAGGSRRSGSNSGDRAARASAGEDSPARQSGRQGDAASGGEAGGAVVQATGSGEAGAHGRESGDRLCDRHGSDGESSDEMEGGDHMDQFGEDHAPGGNSRRVGGSAGDSGLGVKAEKRQIKMKSHVESQRRKRISDGLKRLRDSVKGTGDTATMLDEAVAYVEGLKQQVTALQVSLLLKDTARPQLGGTPPSILGADSALLAQALQQQHSLGMPFSLPGNQQLPHQHQQQQILQQQHQSLQAGPGMFQARQYPNLGRYSGEQGATVSASAPTTLLPRAGWSKRLVETSTGGSCNSPKFGSC
ncbi:unnamed protein product [Closterium sp. NIES-53]